MSLRNLSNEKLQKILIQIEQALYNHEQWHRELVRTFACRTLLNSQDTEENSHTLCRFGQWYYSSNVADLRDLNEFKKIGSAHKQMHKEVRNILNSLETEGVITTQDYDAFSNTLERFRLEMQGLKNKIETLIHYRDPLTMAISRANMLPILREKQTASQRKSDSYFVAMVDIDFFKKVNDAYGHVIGDKVLASVCHCILDYLRVYDKVFRYGGEEFLLLLQHITLDEATKLIERLRKKIEDFDIEVDLEHPVKLTVSIGLAQLDSEHEVEEIIDRADKALYCAKESGRNCTRVWDEKMSK